jgi:hypothetical protein
MSGESFIRALQQTAESRGETVTIAVRRQRRGAILLRNGVRAHVYVTKSGKGVPPRRSGDIGDEDRSAAERESLAKQARYRRRTGSPTGIGHGSKRRWTRHEEAVVLAGAPADDELLATLIDRSVVAIKQRRALLRR